MASCPEQHKKDIFNISNLIRSTCFTIESSIVILQFECRLRYIDKQLDSMYNCETLHPFSFMEQVLNYLWKGSSFDVGSV